jgi:hypothetical protein
MTINGNSIFLNKLKDNGWKEIRYDSEYRKGTWFIIRDTGSWWIVGTESNPRVFDVAEPSDYTAPWTVNLIEHLCKTDEKISASKSG